ncbi:MAG: hypothetical protein WCC99_14225 [Candidatus Sulfotelmatobacter sp.]
MKPLRIAFVLAPLLAVSISFAQSKPGDLVADVPFAFVVAGHTLPPGHYIVNNLNEYLSIHGPQNHGVLVPVHSAQRSVHENTSKMVFHRYGDTYFLSEVWVSGNSIGRTLFPSQGERKLSASGREREIAVVHMEK